MITNVESLGDKFLLWQRTGAPKYRFYIFIRFRYRDAFGFPFVICVRLSNFEMIISEMKKRCQNTAADELSNGIEEVKKIAALRIHDICSKVESCNQ